MISFSVLLSSLLLGSMIFFMAIVLPTVHRSLKSKHAFAFTRDIFPKFYLWGLVISLIALIFSLMAKSNFSFFLGITFLGFAYSRQILLPKLLAARDGWLSSDSPQDKTKYKSLHKKSVLIGATQITLLLIIVVLTKFF